MDDDFAVEVGRSAKICAYYYDVYSNKRIACQ